MDSDKDVKRIAFILSVIIAILLNTYTGMTLWNGVVCHLYSLRTLNFFESFVFLWTISAIFGRIDTSETTEYKRILGKVVARDLTSLLVYGLAYLFVL